VTALLNRFAQAVADSTIKRQITQCALGLAVEDATETIFLITTLANSQCILLHQTDRKLWKYRTQTDRANVR